MQSNRWLGRYDQKMVTVVPDSLTSDSESQIKAGGHDCLTQFHPAIRAWFSRRFTDGPTEPQIQGWAAIREGKDTLISAPTGSGKTLSGFLVAIDALYRAHENGETIGETTSVVYVSPLKALAVDVAENLVGPLDEI